MAGQVCESPREKQGKATGHSRHSSPRPRTRKCQGEVEWAFAHQDSGLKTAFPLGGGWVSGGPLHPSRGLLFRDPLLCHPSQPGAARAPSGWAPFYISSASRGRGAVWEQKLAYALDCPRPSASTSSYSFPGQRARSLERAGVKEGITALPLPHPLLHHRSRYPSAQD